MFEVTFHLKAGGTIVVTCTGVKTAYHRPTGDLLGYEIVNQVTGPGHQKIEFLDFKEVASITSEELYAPGTIIH